MARIVVTGGAGFLGSHLCTYLHDRGDEVVVLDNLLTGDISNIEHLLGRPGFTFNFYDVTKYVWVAGQVDAIMHFASPASPKDYLEMPIQTLKVGSIGTHHCLGFAKEKRAKFFLASTSEVYGDPKVHPQPETYWGHVNPVGPRGVYDEAKRFAEAMAMAYHREHDLDVRIVRIFNTYGPRMRPEDGRVVSNFLVQALTGKPLTIYGDGSQTRSFTYVEDEVRGIVAAAGLELRGADEHRQRRRVHPERAGQAGARSDELGLRNRLRGVADRRPHPTASGSEPGPGRGHRVRTVGAVARGSGEDRPLVRPKAGRLAAFPAVL